MAFLQIEDFEGSIELIAFADAYEKFKHLLAVDSMILVRGAVSKRDEQHPKIKIDNVLGLSESRARLAKSVHIKLRTEGLEEDFIKNINTFCTTIKGECRLVLHLVTQENNEHKVLAKDITVSYEREAIENLRKMVGRDNVWLCKTNV
jgi:DNA polymerase-3 subunit alpha